MHNIKSIRFKGYKAFRNNGYAEINNLSSVNVIIGKNNCGKTSLLEIIEKVFDHKSKLKVGFEIEALQIDTLFTPKMIDAVFAGYSGIGRWNQSNFTEYVKDKLFTADVLANDTFELSKEGINDLRGHIDRANRTISSSRKEYRFRKITAERNIYPEVENENLTLLSGGEGASNLIATFLNDSNYNEAVIENTFLDALNLIMKPEAEFESIRVQQVMHNNKKVWEVFLQEKGQQRVPLSKTGSGLKTIVLVLLNLLVIPLIGDYKDKHIIYGFEELENNLHPALQRRLFEYIYNYSIKNNTKIFLTTHSHIAINAYFDKTDTSIYHVIKENGCALIKQIESYIDKTEILNDLDVKASDILQSNGIIWVEGPSDRIYIKRWLEVLTPNEYEEGKHYQFLYYGGRLLAQYSAKEITDLINIITTNRNAAIVMDSDKTSRNSKINETKKRIMTEFDALSMFHWITKGKEIENYLPKQAIEDMLEVKIKKVCTQYQLFPEYIKKYYKSFSSKKVPFANEIKGFITKENSIDIFDLKKQIEQLYKQIQKWNR